MAAIFDVDEKPQINYPLFWEYKIIFLGEFHIDDIVGEIIKNKEFKIIPSKESKGKKYKSYNISILVYSEIERLEYFNTFKTHPNIKYVL